MTPEQITQWAREAGFAVHRDEYEFKEMLRLFAIRAYTEGRAEQAEVDAKLCDSRARTNNMFLDRQARVEAQDCAAAIRTAAPKANP